MCLSIHILFLHKGKIAAQAFRCASAGALELAEAGRHQSASESNESSAPRRAPAEHMSGRSVQTLMRGTRPSSVALSSSTKKLASIFICNHTELRKCVCIYIYIYMSVCLSACLPGWLAVCMYVCMYACMDVCMYVLYIQAQKAGC